MEVKIIIPSHKRAASLITHKMVSNAIVCVPNNQVDQYKEYNPTVEIVGHDNDLIGISPKRQWILDKFGDTVQMDDDIKALRRTYLAGGQKMEKFTPDQVYGLIQDTYNMLKGTPIKLFSWSKSATPLHFDETKPIKLTGITRGAAFGIINDGSLSFPSTSDLIGEDDYLSLLNAHNNRLMWIDNRFYFDYKTNNHNIGGCGDIRQGNVVKDSYTFMRKTFGEAVVKEAGSWLWRSKIPY